MPSSLRNRLSELASSFSASLLEAIRGASLEELLGGQGRVAAAAALATRGIQRAAAATKAPAAAPAKRGRAGRLGRRTASDITGLVEKIASLLAASPAGLRAEQIRQELGLQAKELPRPLKEGLDAGRFSKSGQKRATTYSVGGAGQKVAARAARAASAKRGQRAVGAAPAAVKGRRGAAKRGAAAKPAASAPKPSGRGRPAAAATAAKTARGGAPRRAARAAKKG
jgi:hypothetical protein